MKMKELMDSVRKFTDENAPTILAVVAGVGVVGTAIVAVGDTLKAQKVINAKQPQTKKEIIKETWTCYVPTACVAGTTIFAIGMGTHISNQRILALTSALALNSNAFKEYKKKAEEIFGAKETQKVQDAVAQDKVLAKRPRDIGTPPFGTIRCMDSVTGQEFYSNMSDLARAEAEINRQLYTDQWYSFSDLLWSYGGASSVIAQHIGWNVDDGPIQFNYTSCLNSNNVPVLVVNYSTLPTTLSFDR